MKNAYSESCIKLAECKGNFGGKSGSLTTLQTTTVAPFLAWRGLRRNALDCRRTY